MRGGASLAPGLPAATSLAYSSLSLNARTRADARTQTGTPEIKQNEWVRATVLTCLLNLPDMRSDQRALRLEVKKQIIKYLDSDLFFCPDLA